MDFTALREALGAAADVPDDQLLDEVRKLRTERATLTEKVTTLSRQPAAPDPEILRDRAELTAGRIDLAVQRGDLPPFIATKLKAKVTDGGKPNVFMLSRADDLGDRPVDFVLSLFDGAKLGPKAGSETGVQLLSRDVPGEPEAKPVTQEQTDALLAKTELGRRYLAERDARK